MLAINRYWRISFILLFRLHAVAAELAIEATKKFFEDLRAAVGDHKFARFLNLQAVRTLALVIDDTGSMGGTALNPTQAK